MLYDGPLSGRTIATAAAILSAILGSDTALAQKHE
jgi:hypothetical protein